MEILCGAFDHSLNAFNDVVVFIFDSWNATVYQSIFVELHLIKVFFVGICNTCDIRRTHSYFKISFKTLNKYKKHILTI